MDDLKDLIINLIIVAFLAALGEELLFRGVIQTVLKEWTKSPIVAIWITAVFFSAFHMQFYGFLPRMLLGALLGYLFHWRNSIWLPVLAHFINNAAAVFLSYFIAKGSFPKDIETIGSSETDWLLLVGSAISVFLLLRYIYLISQRAKNSNYSRMDE